MAFLHIIVMSKIKLDAHKIEKNKLSKTSETLIKQGFYKN